MQARIAFTIVAILCLNLVLTGAAAARGTSPAIEASGPHLGWDIFDPMYRLR